MTHKERNIIISRLLKLAANAFSDFGCNDLDAKFFDGIPEETKKELSMGVWRMCGEEGEVEEAINLSDVDLFEFFADLVIVPVEANIAKLEKYKELLKWLRENEKNAAQDVLDTSSIGTKLACLGKESAYRGIIEYITNQNELLKI